jgi:AsmA protein
MSRAWKRTLWALGAVLGIVLVGAAIVLLSWRGPAKAQLQAAASDALGMQVSIGGAVRLRLFPGVSLTLEEVRIRSAESEWAAAGRVTLGIELLSLLRRQVRLRSIEVQHLSIELERGRDGKLNVGGSAAGSGPLPNIDSTDLSLTDLNFTYTNRQQASRVHAGSCDVRATGLRLAPTPGASLMQSLSGSAKVSCARIDTSDLPMSAVEFPVRAAHGVLEADNITLRVWGGEGGASVRADFSGPAPLWRVRGQLSKLQLAELSKTISRKRLGDGLMEFSGELTMSGSNADEMTRSSSGRALLRGTDLTLGVGDLDDELAHYKSAQHFSLVDLGAFLLAGPIGLAVTKGYDYAKIVDSSGGTSRVRQFVADWQVEHGVAEARDVAMSTTANRVALTGGLDFVDHAFQDVTVAVLNERGCATLEQKVHGSFSHPQVEGLNVVSALAAPARNLFDKARHLVSPAAHCEVFYTGSIAPPH